MPSSTSSKTLQYFYHISCACHSTFIGFESLGRGLYRVSGFETEQILGYHIPSVQDLQISIQDLRGISFFNWIFVFIPLSCFWIQDLRWPAPILHSPIFFYMSMFYIHHLRPLVSRFALCRSAPRARARSRR